MEEPIEDWDEADFEELDEPDYTVCPECGNDLDWEGYCQNIIECGWCEPDEE